MQELPKRKRLRLKNHDYSEDGFYFITICTKERRCFLSEIISDGESAVHVRLKPYGAITEDFIKGIPGIDRYVIMPNHVHLIISKTNGKSIAQDIRALKGLITKRIGESIWQTSYYDHIIRNDEDYMEKCRYIEENPVRWTMDEYNTYPPGA